MEFQQSRWSFGCSEVDSFPTTACRDMFGNICSVCVVVSLYEELPSYRFSPSSSTWLSIPVHLSECYYHLYIPLKNKTIMLLEYFLYCFTYLLISFVIYVISNLQTNTLYPVSHVKI